MTFLFRDYAHSFGYAVNEDFGGHGIAHHMHMSPMVYHHKTKSASKAEMRPGMAFTIEPILMMSNDYQYVCLLYTSPSPRDRQKSRMPSSA